jgi:tRNA-Thr(GGU) m(6)t(6)A37 methyltransferase TsaA
MRKMKIEYRPIGVVHSPFAEIERMPIQPSRAKAISGTVEVSPEFQEGLQDLEGFSHIILLYHLHKAAGYSLKVVPFLDTEPRGVFATRAPKRPNPIGLSVLRLNGIQGNTLSVSDLDILDETPVLDIKPFVPDFDTRSETRTGWLETAKKRRDSVLSDGRFR